MAMSSCVRNDIILANGSHVIHTGGDDVLPVFFDILILNITHSSVSAAFPFADNNPLHIIDRLVFLSANKKQKSSRSSNRKKIKN